MAFDERDDDRRDRAPASGEHRERQRDQDAVGDRQRGEHDVLAQVRVDLVLVVGDPRPPHPRVRVVRQRGKVQGADGTVLAPVIRLESVRKQYPSGLVAVDDLSLDVPTGEVCVLVGPSGCGKTTILRMINRLIEPTAGTILVDDEDILKIDPVELRRRIGYVIQQVGLFPHQTVGTNIATVPRLLGWDRARVNDARRRAARARRACRPPSTATGTRPSSPAVNANASASPAPSRPIRRSC